MILWPAASRANQVSIPYNFMPGMIVDVARAIPAGVLGEPTRENIISAVGNLKGIGKKEGTKVPPAVPQKWQRLIEGVKSWEGKGHQKIVKEIESLLESPPGKSQVSTTHRKEQLDLLHLRINTLPASAKKRLSIGVAQLYLRQRYFAESLRILYQLYKTSSEARILYDAVQSIYSQYQKGGGSVALQSL